MTVAQVPGKVAYPILGRAIPPGHRVAAALLGLCASAALCQDLPRAPSDAPHATPDAIVRIFVDACVLGEGEMTPAIDRGISQGMNPRDATLAEVRPLLDGQQGTVLAMPDVAAPVLLAITPARRCTVWAERANGPALRNAFQRALAPLEQRGFRVKPMFDRTLERAGAWRQHVQMSVRRSGGAQDFALGAVTTLGSEPASQALQFGPLPAALPGADLTR